MAAAADGIFVRCTRSRRARDAELAAARAFQPLEHHAAGRIDEQRIAGFERVDLHALARGHEDLLVAHFHNAAPFRRGALKRRQIARAPALAAPGHQRVHLAVEHDRVAGFERRGIDAAVNADRAPMPARKHFGARAVGRRTHTREARLDPRHARELLDFFVESLLNLPQLHQLADELAVERLRMLRRAAQNAHRRGQVLGRHTPGRGARQQFEQFHFTDSVRHSAAPSRFLDLRLRHGDEPFLGLKCRVCRGYRVRRGCRKNRPTYPISPKDPTCPRLMSSAPSAVKKATIDFTHSA